MFHGGESTFVDSSLEYFKKQLIAVSLSENHQDTSAAGFSDVRSLFMVGRDPLFKKQDQL